MKPLQKAGMMAMRIWPVLKPHLWIVLLSWIAFLGYGLAWPTHPGRDFENYIYYYADFFTAKPAYPMLMAYRTPVAPFFIGTLYTIGKTSFVVFGFGVLYCASIVATKSLASILSKRIGTIAAVALLLYPPYGALFHEVASDSVFAALLIIWLAVAARGTASGNIKLLGIGSFFLGLLILTRPSAQILIAASGIFLVVTRWPWKQRFTALTATTAPALLMLIGWSAHNFIRYDDFAISRGSGAIMPLYRLFVYDRLVRAENGPASKELADAIETDLLGREPYKSAAINGGQFFQAGSARMWGDLVPLSDRLWGWDSDYSHLRSVAIETIRKNPEVYAQAVWRTFNETLYEHYAPATVRRKKATTAAKIEGNAGAEPNKIAVDRSAVWWPSSSPDGSSRPDAIARLHTRFSGMKFNLPARSGNEKLARMLKECVTSAWPPMIAFIGCGFAGLLFANGRKRRYLTAMSGIVIFCLGHNLAVLLGIYSIPQMHLPFSAIFIVFGIAGAASFFEESKEP